jgi:hypothetical protein
MIGDGGLAAHVTAIAGAFDHRSGPILAQTVWQGHPTAPQLNY